MKAIILGLCLLFNRMPADFRAEFEELESCTYDCLLLESLDWLELNEEILKKTEKEFLLAFEKLEEIHFKNENEEKLFNLLKDFKEGNFFKKPQNFIVVENCEKCESGFCFLNEKEKHCKIPDEVLEILCSDTFLKMKKVETQYFIVEKTKDNIIIFWDKDSCLFEYFLNNF